MMLLIGMVSDGYPGSDKNKDRWEDEKKERERERRMTLEMWEGLTVEEKVDNIVAEKVKEELPGEEKWSRIEYQRGESTHRSLVESTYRSHSMGEEMTYREDIEEQKETFRGLHVGCTPS